MFVQMYSGINPSDMLLIQKFCCFPWYVEFRGGESKKVQSVIR